MKSAEVRCMSLLSLSSLQELAGSCKNINTAAHARHYICHIVALCSILGDIFQCGELILVHPRDAVHRTRVNGRLQDKELPTLRPAPYSFTPLCRITAVHNAELSLLDAMKNDKHSSAMCDRSLMSFVLGMLQ